MVAVGEGFQPQAEQELQEKGTMAGLLRVLASLCLLAVEGLEQQEMPQQQRHLPVALDHHQASAEAQ